MLTILYATMPGTPSRASQKSGAMTPSLRFSARVSSAALRTSLSESWEVSRPTMRETWLRPRSSETSRAANTPRTSLINVVPARQ